MNVRSESRAGEDWWPCGKRFRMSITEGTEEHDMNFKYCETDRVSWQVIFPAVLYHRCHSPLDAIYDKSH